MNRHVNYSRTNAYTYHLPLECLCGRKDCTCLPLLQDIKLRPGEKYALFHARIMGLNGFYTDTFVRSQKQEIVYIKDATGRQIEGMKKLMDALLRKTVHVSGQDEETRVWATEQLLEAPNLFREVIS